MSIEYEKAVESVAATAAAHAAEVDRGAFPEPNLRALSEAGLLGLVSAADVGGQGLGLAAAAHVVERRRECGSTAGPVHALLRAGARAARPSSCAAPSPRAST
jgi:alkylation response protein AidB-like acyl-CoA dehydrogenase